MFGWIRKMMQPEMAPEGPVTFDFEIEIATPAERIYSLIDFASPTNAKRELGHSVEQVSSNPEIWKLVIAQMPDATFLETVTEATAPLCYSYRSVAEPQQGAMQWTEERWTIQPQQDGARCLVTLLVEAQFDEPLPMSDHQDHVIMMAMGCNNAVEKLKLHAEKGVAAVREVEAQQFR
ncbi:SRPBCC family protein [Qipengyuania zhejiangensis]|uniref:SRPBCC family protein n=1 Tax=Qipengyuania zhejiangensis TaxID=3077782 RepID=UPI002D77332E|nr:SRPBCC family protein [Qipengyuania sp. Z2]